METISNYTVAVQHDNGTAHIQTAAQSPEQAKQAVCNAEGCPEGAILSVTEIKINQ
jgi:hypothetical protein